MNLKSGQHVSRGKGESQFNDFLEKKTRLAPFAADFGEIWSRRLRLRLFSEKNDSGGFLCDFSLGKMTNGGPAVIFPCKKRQTEARQRVFPAKNDKRRSGCDYSSGKTANGGPAASFPREKRQTETRLQFYLETQKEVMPLIAG